MKVVKQRKDGVVQRYNKQDERKYVVVYWADEERREEGISDYYGEYTGLQKAISEARRAFSINDYPAVEVQTREDEEPVFIFTTEKPSGEAVK